MCLIDRWVRLAKLPVLIPRDESHCSRQEMLDSLEFRFCLRLFGKCKLWTTRRTRLTIAVALIACFAVETRAQGPAARDYLNTPVVFGSPALRLEEFPKAVPKTFSSFHLTVSAPLGSYDRNSPVNTGANRWSFTPVVNLDITPDKGVSWIDLYAGGRFVTNNNAYLGNHVLPQNPLGVLTVHYSHNIGKRMWASIGVHYDNGGRSFINHIPQNDYANGFRSAVAVSRRFGKFGVTLRYENTASKPNAGPTNGLLSLRLAAPLFPF
jgi:hypothetical protein